MTTRYDCVTNQDTPPKRVDYMYGSGKTCAELDELADRLVAWVNDNVKTEKQFMLGDFAFINGIRTGHMLKYARHHERFKEAFMWGKDWQEHMMSKGAAYGRVAHRYAIFFLACQHGWKEAQGEAREEVFATAFDRFVAQMKKDERKEAITDIEDV